MQLNSEYQEDIGSGCTTGHISLQANGEGQEDIWIWLHHWVISHYRRTVKAKMTLDLGCTTGTYISHYRRTVKAKKTLDLAGPSWAISHYRRTVKAKKTLDLAGPSGAISRSTRENSEDQEDIGFAWTKLGHILLQTNCKSQ